MSSAELSYLNQSWLVFPFQEWALFQVERLCDFGYILGFITQLLRWYLALNLDKG